MIDYLFLRHPRSVEESYGAHFLVASSFFATLFVAALAALVHAIVPCLFKTTASRLVNRLHDRMVANRIRHRRSEAITNMAGDLPAQPMGNH